MSDEWPISDPRFSGVQEHYERIRTFLDLSCKCAEPEIVFRLQMAGVYSARAVIELIFEAAGKGQLSTSREQLKERLPTQLRWYNLIERIRIHDFHRFGLTPPNSSMKTLLGGPIELRAHKGKAMYKIPPTGPEKETTGRSSIKEQRPLLSSSGLFYDEETRQYVAIKRILEEFMCDIRAVIDDFRQNLKCSL